MSFNFMAAVTICSDLGAQKIKSDTVSTVSKADPDMVSPLGVSQTSEEEMRAKLSKSQQKEEASAD